MIASIASIRRLGAGAIGLGLLCVAPAARAEGLTVAKRLNERGIEHEVDKDGDYKVTYNYKKDGRTQLVFVGGKTEAIGSFVIREVFAPAARIDEDKIDGARALDLLRESSKNKLGAWEIRGDVLYFVVKLPDTVDAADLERAMDVAAETADDMEIKYSGGKDEL